MHSAIVNGYKLLCDPYTVLEQHRVTSTLFAFYLLSSFSAFFYCVSHSDSPISFLGACLVCVNNLKRTVDLVLRFPDRTSVCTHPCLIVLNLTKINYIKVHL